MHKLRFALTFKGGKADKHRLPVYIVAEIIRYLNDDLLGVCQELAANDSKVSPETLKRECALWVVGFPKKSSATFDFETDPLSTEWPIIAAETYISAIKHLPAMTNAELPRGFTEIMLQHAKLFADPPSGEYVTMRLSIPENGKPRQAVDFDDRIRIAAEKGLRELSKIQPVIYGHSIQGIMYGLEDQNYSDPKARVSIEVDTGDGLRWVCSLGRNQVPNHLADKWKIKDRWTKHVAVKGIARFKPKKPEMEVEQIEILPERLLPSELFDKVKKNTNLWKDETTSAFLDRVRERNE
jgi:hypothetical protein